MKLENISKLADDKRIDLTIAFRVVGKEKDGSQIVIWKELNRQNSPELLLGKMIQLSNLKPE